MIASDYTLELCNVFYSGQVEPGSCFQRVVGNVKTGLILKDVSLTVHSGEVLAVLGSKGSGKKALLDVISRRVQGPTRGQILLNNQPMSLCLFQQRCGYVTHKCDLISGLTVEETLYYTPTRTTSYLKRTKVKQIMADLALSQVANTCVENLAKSEYRRLIIGIQLIKEPAILLLDEPTWDLDPLNTYLVVSILSNAAKKYGIAIVLTMEKPRSDVFPFLERVLYLCLGDVVYTGSTRHMLEYFNAIGFPCPQLENPLMYYLCLSTVDRRSRQRFEESNHQIAALVEKFKIEGGIYRKNQSVNGVHNTQDQKNPLLLPRPNPVSVGMTIFTRLLSITLNFRKAGLQQIFLRLCFLPLFFLVLWIFYHNMQDYQHTFITRSGLVFNCLAATYFSGILNTIFLYPKFRTRYFQESQEGLYGGTIFLLTYNTISMQFSFISVLAATAIIYPLIGHIQEPMNYIYFALVLWACYIFSEQQTMAVLMVIKNNISAAVCSIYITCLCMALSSGILRSIKSLQGWLYYLTYATQTRYAAAFLACQVFMHPDLQNPLPFSERKNCTSMSIMDDFAASSKENPECRFLSGQSFLVERYTRDNSGAIFTGFLDFEFNIGITFVFSLGIIIFNLFLYLLPLPAFIKAKFRE